MHLVAVAALSGCGAPSSQLVYEHDWSYGPGYPGRNDDQGDPLFLGYFRSDVAGSWRLEVEAAIESGTFEVQLRDPVGSVRARANASGVTPVAGASGDWSVEILTDQENGEFPAGRIRLWVRADG